MIDDLELGIRVASVIFYENYAPQTSGLLPLCGGGAIRSRVEEALRRRYPALERLKVRARRVVRPDGPRRVNEALQAPFGLGLEVKVPGRNEWVDIGVAASAGYVRQIGALGNDSDLSDEIIIHHGAGATTWE